MKRIYINEITSWLNNAKDYLMKKNRKMKVKKNMLHDE